MNGDGGGMVLVRHLRLTTGMRIFSRETWARLIAGLVIAFMAGAIVAIGVKDSGGWVAGTRWDLRVLQHARASLPTWADALLLAIPWLGTNITIFALLVPFAVWLHRRQRADIVAQLGAAAVGNYLLNLITKSAFGRPRPSLWPRRGEYMWASYPSGHMIAMLSVLLFAAWLLYRERRQIWAYCAWLPAFAATLYSRLYLGVHWPTDVVGGLAIGFVWFLALWLTFRRPNWRSKYCHPRGFQWTGQDGSERDLEAK